MGAQACRHHKHLERLPQSAFRPHASFQTQARLAFVLPTSTCGKADPEARSRWLVVANLVMAMSFAWFQPWSHRRRARTTPTLAAAISRLPFLRQNRLATICTRSAPDSARLDPSESPIERVTLSLPHHLDVSQVTQRLTHQLDCDGWHVGCRHDHQVVVQLTRGGVARYGVSYECSPAVEKAVYHGSRAWSLTIIPLHGSDNLPAEKVTAIKASLAELHG